MHARISIQVLCLRSFQQTLISRIIELTADIAPALSQTSASQILQTELGNLREIARSNVFVRVQQASSDIRSIQIKQLEVESTLETLSSRKRSLETEINSQFSIELGTSSRQVKKRSDLSMTNHCQLLRLVILNYPGTEARTAQRISSHQIRDS